MVNFLRLPRPACSAGIIAAATLFGMFVVAGEEESKTERTRRERMVAAQIEKRGIKDPAVLAAMRKVPRHRFVPEEIRDQAYEDHALPIGEGQTISQPLIVAEMTAAIRPRKDMKVLEVGTGSGYQAAVLAACVSEVDSIEVIPTLGRRAEALLKELEIKNVRVHIGDGYDGWAERAPYDAILLTAAPAKVPRPLLEQLRVGGKLVAPLGARLQDQQLVVITRTEKGFETEVLDAVRFVPMTGKAAAEK